MSKPTINYLAEHCAVIVAQGADASFVALRVFAWND